MIKLLFASNNKGKYDELVDNFAEVGIELIFDGNLELQEDALTLEQNAILKAQCASKQRNMLSIGEDTGFYIRALDYFPGVHANRWMEGTWKDKRDAVLKMMEGKTDRVAYLINNFAVTKPDGTVLLTTKVKNAYEICYEDHVNPEFETFGYNNILMMQGYYIGDLNKEQRNFLKHRGRIASEVLNCIKQNFTELELSEYYSEKLMKEYEEAYKKLAE
jgi:XTP/dITP diphosphohydrolase